jgi:hypothetical protein
MILRRSPARPARSGQAATPLHFQVRRCNAMGETLVNVKAESVEEFVKSVSKEVGEGAGVMGATTYDIASSYDYDDDGNVKNVKFKLTVNIKRAHWSGGKPDAANKKAIQTAEDLNKKHELKHKKVAEEICSREFKTREKELTGKAEYEVESAITEMRALIDADYDALDAKEGLTDVTQNANGSFTVKLKGR